MTPQSPAQFGICSWNTKPQSVDDLIKSLHALGLKKVQLGIKPLREKPESWQNVKERLAAVGITIVSGMLSPMGQDYKTLESIRRTGGFVADERWEENRRWSEITAETAAQLGLKNTLVHAGFVPEDHQSRGFAVLVERLQIVTDIFGRHGLNLMLETGQETPETLLAFLAAVDRKNLFVNLDGGNMVLYNTGDPVASLKKLYPKVIEIHIKDAAYTEIPGTWGKEVPIGEGVTDWRAFIRFLVENDYRGNLVIEREAGAERIGDIRKAISFLSGIMQESSKPPVESSKPPVVGTTG
jgi:L-ribulose-5-phosphate 3-epimerase